ncbi:GntR family transcriptional regulator [Patulibacter sp. S7RM1-6]
MSLQHDVGMSWQAFDIDRTSPVPFYAQLAEAMAAEIAAGRWPRGERIASESALCATFGVSRTTVRQALGELVQRGLLRKERGRGTFVDDPPASSVFLQSTYGFHEEAERAGRTVRSRILRLTQAPLPRWATAALELPDDAAGVTLERVRVLDGRPVMYVTSHLVPELAGLLDARTLEHGSLYRALQAGGVVAAGGSRVMHAAAATTEIAGHLDVAPGTPLLAVEAVSWGSGRVPFETYRAWHLTDRARLHVEMVGGPPPADIAPSAPAREHGGREGRAPGAPTKGPAVAPAGGAALADARTTGEGRDPS